MRTLVRGGLLTGLAIVIVVAVANWGTSSDPLIKPPRRAVPTDGRAVVVLQLCWWPDQVGGVVRSTIGTAERADVEFDIPCNHPWTTRGLVSHGDKIMLGWTMNPREKVKTRKVDLRVSINNHEVKRLTKTTAIGDFTCMAGIPPCVAPGGVL